MLTKLRTIQTPANFGSESTILGMTQQEPQQAIQQLVQTNLQLCLQTPMYLICKSIQTLAPLTSVKVVNQALPTTPHLAATSNTLHPQASKPSHPPT